MSFGTFRQEVLSKLAALDCLDAHGSQQAGCQNVAFLDVYECDFKFFDPKAFPNWLLAKRC